MLQARNVCFHYPKTQSDQNILNDLSVTFEKGTFYTIFGPSGCGKTTLLSLLGGLEIPTSGTITIEGQSFETMDQPLIRRKYVSYIFQNYLLFPYLTAVENIVVAMNIFDPETALNNKKRQAEEILHTLGLEQKDIHRKVRSLSGGQQQRVAIARTICFPGAYVLADEPTGNLDKKNALSIIKILKDLVSQYQKCLIVVTHSDLIRKKSDISYYLDDGALTRYDDTQGASV